MADERLPQHPQPPEGFQRPGIPGAGNLLDPAVRGEVREQLHPLVHDTGRQLQHAQAQQTAQATQSATAPALPLPTGFRAGPFAHGDVDLSNLPANVPPEPVRPHRGRAGRRYYFLKDDATNVEESSSVRPPAAGPKPG